MAGKDISITGKDGNFAGYLATPAGGKGPGVVVIQEIFGINPWVSGVCDWYAAQGYIALAPDLFWRLKPGIQLDPMKDADFEQGLDYMGKFNFDQGIGDIQTTITTLRSWSGGTGKVGHLGFCMGGFLAFLTAARTDSDAGASYYGGGTHTVLAEAAKVKKPTLLHFAGTDEYMPAAAQQQIKDAVEGNPNITVHVYPGTAHGFCRSTDPRHYNAEACTLAHSRTLDLFKKALA